jgi:hypothetical protein
MNPIRKTKLAFLGLVLLGVGGGVKVGENRRFENP